MAGQGKDEGKEGKDKDKDGGEKHDLAAELGRRALLGNNRMALPVRRLFFRALLEPVSGTQVTRELQEKRRNYYAEARTFGLIDGDEIIDSSGKVTLVVVGRDADEAKDLLEGDPLVESGALRISSIDAI
jgi:hypothetical protein